MSDGSSKLGGSSRGGVTRIILADVNDDGEVKQEETPIYHDEWETLSMSDDDDDDDEDDEEAEEEIEGEDAASEDKSTKTYNITNNITLNLSRSALRPQTLLPPSEVNLNIAGGNDISRQFYEIVDSINAAYMTGVAWDEDTTIIRHLVNRLILLWKRQNGERKAVREGWFPEASVDTFFSFDIPHWTPERNAPPSMYREWVKQLLFLLTPH